MGLIFSALCLVLAFSVSPVEATHGKVTSEKGLKKCFDFVDNDHDGATDAADPDCGGSSGGDPTFEVALVDHTGANLNSTAEVCANEAFPGMPPSVRNIVIGLKGFAFVPNDDSAITVRFNMTNPETRTLVDITWHEPEEAVALEIWRHGRSFLVEFAFDTAIAGRASSTRHSLNFDERRVVHGATHSLTSVRRSQLRSMSTTPNSPNPGRCALIRHLPPCRAVDRLDPSV